MSTKTIDDLREAMFDTIQALKAGTLDVDRARAINHAAQVIVDSARVEVDFIRATDGDRSRFLGSAAAAPILPAPAGDKPPNGIAAIVRHRLQG